MFWSPNYYPQALVTFTLAFFVIFIFWGLSSTSKENFHNNLVKGYKFHEIKEFAMAAEHFDNAIKYAGNPDEKFASIKGAIYSYISMGSPEVCNRLRGVIKLRPADKEVIRLTGYIDRNEARFKCDL